MGDRVTSSNRMTAAQPALQQVKASVVKVIRDSPLFTGDSEQARELAVAVLTAQGYYPLRAAVDGRADERMI